MCSTWPFAAVEFKAFCMTFVSSPPKPALPRLSRFTDGKPETDEGDEPGAEPEEAAAGDELSDLGDVPARPPPHPQA